MKRIIVLTSILALSACGGGSGGGGNYVAPGAVESTFVPLTDTVASSNSEITGMVSNSEAQVVTYVVNKLGNDAETVGLGGASRPATIRGAFTPSVSAGSDDYSKARELMELAQWLGQADTTHEDITSLFNKSKTDQNKIKSALKLLDDMYCYVGGSADETARRILEQRNQNKFEKPLEEIKDKSEIILLKNVIFKSDEWVGNGIDEQTWTFDVDADGRINKLINVVNSSKYDEHGTDIYERISDTVFESEFDDGGRGHASLEMYGKTAGLKYSDFGVVHLRGIDTDMPPMDDMLAGGQEPMIIDHANIDGKITFNGRAIGSVRESDENNETPLGDPSEMLHGAAELTFENGKTSLDMRFSESGWHDVHVDTDANGQVINTTFTGNVDQERFGQWELNSNSGNDKAILNHNFYGRDNTPTEVSGTFNYTDTGTRDVLEAAFGGTRK